MWIGYNEQNENYNSIFAIMGKGLRLCQNLEINIKHILQIIEIENAIKKNDIKDIFNDEWNSIINQIEKYHLKRRINQIINLGGFSEEIKNKLDKGREARNRIIHEGSYILSDTIHRGIINNEELAKYLDEIKKVAIADNIVSGWIWRINEKTPPCKSESQYILEILKWIKDE